jgi:hypothetical protein
MKGKESQKRGVKKCYYCDKEGHIKKDCYKFKRDQNDNNEEETGANAAWAFKSAENQVKHKWIVDSGATRHMTGQKAILSDFKIGPEVQVVLADGSFKISNMYGKATAMIGGNEVVVSNVCFVEALDANLLSR